MEERLFLKNLIETAVELLQRQLKLKRKSLRCHQIQNRFSFDRLESRHLLSAVRIANWNVNNLPNGPVDDSNFETVIEAIGQEEVLGSSREIDVLVLGETDTASAVRLDGVFDSLYNTTAYEFVVSTSDGGSDRTGFIYNSDTVSLLETFELPDQSLTHRALRAKFRPAGATALADFFVYAVHLKSGAGSSNVNIRTAEASIIRSDGDSLGDGTNVIYAGDFNLQGSSEGAWSSIIAAGPGSARDAANTPGQWASNPTFVSVHSHSANQLDDRFDLQFISEELQDGFGFDYVDGSIHVFGNNGSHDFDGTITTGNGAAPEVLESLLMSSDHLPVVADYEIVSELPQVIVVQSAGSTVVAEGGANDSYDIFLGSIPDSDVIVSVVPDSQIDLGAGPGVASSLVFTPANANSPQVIFVSAFDDDLKEGTHSGLIEHFAMSNDPDYDGIAIVSLTVAITDNDSLLTQPLLNEIYVDPPGADDNREYIEILAPPLQPLTNVWLLEIDGDGSSAGVVDNAQNLGSLSPGSNGLLLLGDDYLTVGHPWTDDVDPATVVGNLFNSPIENGSITFLLVENFSESTGVDLDTNNDGVLDFTPWEVVWDGVGWIDGADDRSYSAATIDKSSSPDAATRIPFNYDANSSAAWYSGQITGEGTNKTYDESADTPEGAEITPGDLNYFPFIGEVFPDSIELIQGTVGSGGIAELQFSDDQYLKIYASESKSILDAAVSIEFTAISPDETPDSLAFKFESSASTLNLSQAIELFNFDSKQFELIDVRAASPTDAQIEVVLSGDTSRFVDTLTGELEARVTWNAVGPVVGFPWSISIDQVAWDINSESQASVLFNKGSQLFQNDISSSESGILAAYPSSKIQAGSATQYQAKSDPVSELHNQTRSRDRFEKLDFVFSDPPISEPLFQVSKSVTETSDELDFGSLIEPEFEEFLFLRISDMLSYSKQTSG